MSRYRFRKIRKEEIPQVLQLVLERMKRMDEQGIRQWNATNYDRVYPQSYYEECRKRGELFALEDTEADEIVCAAVLKENDARWDGDAPARYLHNFVAKTGRHGMGSMFLRKAEKYARVKGKTYMRLDSAVDNPVLAEYDAFLGFPAVGNCEDGPYKGVLRQKRPASRGRQTESFTRQESLGKFVQKITKRRFTPGNSRVIIKLHGVRKERVSAPCLGEIAVPGRQIYRR